MKVCIIAHGGPHSNNWINYLLDNKNNELFYLGDKEGRNKHIKSFIVPFHGLVHYFLLLLSTQLVVRFHKPDIIISQYLTYHGFIASLLFKYKKISVGIGSDVNLIGSSFLTSKLSLFTARKSDTIIVVSKTLKKKLVQNNIEQAKITIIPNGINKATKLASLNKINAHLNDKNKKEIKIIYTRGFNPVYDPLTFIKSIKYIVKRFPDSQFYLFGKGKFETFAMEYIKRKKLENNVFFLGWVPENELIDFHERSLVYVTSSLSDGISVALLKGILFYNIIVASNIDANTNLVKDFKLDPNSFFYFNCGNHIELANQIITAIENSTKLKESLVLNHDIILKKFSNEENFKKLDEIMNKLITDN